MSTAQILILARGPADIASSVFNTAVEAAARAVGLTPGRWTYDATPVTLDASGTVAGGPWNGYVVDGASAGRTVFTAYRQNLSGFSDDPTRKQAQFDALLGPARTALSSAGAVASRSTFYTIGHPISWDRNIPAAIPLEEGGGGRGIALVAILGLAALGTMASSRRSSGLSGAKHKPQRAPKRRSSCGCEG